MKLALRILPLLLLLEILALSPDTAFARQQFGMFYQDSAAENITADELEWLEDAGFTWLMVREPLTPEQRRLIHETGFSVYVLIPEEFAIPARLAKASRRYFERADSLMRYFRHDPFVKGYGMLSFSDWQEAPLPDRLESLAAPYRENRCLFVLDTRPFNGPSLDPFDRVMLYSRSAARLEHQLRHDPPLSGVLYRPESQQADIRDIQNAIALLSGDNRPPLFFEREWFLRNAQGDTIANGTGLDRLTAFHARVPDARLANPAPPDNADLLDYSILMLFLIWAAYTAFYRLNPIYRKSLSRYFLNYDFFVNDVLMRRIRLPGDATVLFILWGVVGGLMAFTTAHIYLDRLSMGALLTYMPIIPSGWVHPLHFFGFFFLITLLVNTIQIGWIRIANYKHSHLSQIATFVLWAQHLNLLIVSAGVILLRIVPSEIVVVSMFLLFWVNIFASFFLTAYNMRRITPTSPMYMAGTYALFVLVVSTLVFWFVFAMDIMPAWKLASGLAAY
ncbi:hypothetical protein QA596_00965 [Balneolales bacterium ANBcel1]|nr:hypothetical protein [Balneolales bacterium ANBcel1]